MRPPASPALPPVPIQETVGEFIGALVGSGAAATKVRPSPVGPDGEHVVATYRDDVGRTAVVVTADLAFAAATAAALALIPAAALTDVLRAGRLSADLHDNFREVANVLAALLNTPSTPHVALAGTWTTDDPACPAEVWTILESPSKRREYAVAVGGYGEGRFGIAIA